MKVPFYLPEIGGAEEQAVLQVLRSGWLTTGPKTREFETNFAAFAGAAHAVAVNSATAALHLALEAIGVTRGDAVLVPTMTFAATAEVVRYFDAEPVLVDCRASDYNLDPQDLRQRAAAAQRAGKKLKAIMPVHYGGQICDLAAVIDVANELGLQIIEDAAHCCPAYYRHDASSAWLPAGAEASVGCYSFYANKCITTGEGGMACTNDAALAERMRVMALHGISKDAWKRFTSEGNWYYEIIAPGYKYNLTDIAAAIGVEQLKRAHEFREARARVAGWYRERLQDAPGIALPVEAPNRVHAWHLFVVRFKSDELAVTRDTMIETLKTAGIGTSVHWIPLHLHPYYRKTYGYTEEAFPVATRLSREIVSLPIFPAMTEAQVDHVAAVLRQALAKYRR